MIDLRPKAGIIVPDWDALRRDDFAFADFMRAVSAFDTVLIYSHARTSAATTILRDRLPKSFLASPRILSEKRLARLCDRVYLFEGRTLHNLEKAAPRARERSRIGFIVSNGNGLGHVTRAKALAEGLKAHAPHAFMSFSSAMAGEAFYQPSYQSLRLDAQDGFAYTREACRRFMDQANPSHIVWDGNVIPEGLLSVLAARPDIHLTWMRRGMWQKTVAPSYMAQQALVDLVIEPGDVAEAYDDGPSWKARGAFTPPRAFYKTLPIQPVNDNAQTLKLDPARKYALVMTGAGSQDLAHRIVDQVRACDMVPVIAHWPMAGTKPLYLDGAQTIEQRPIAPHYQRFDVIISAAGYNSFHEILAGGYPAIFVPQEDEGRDNQLARARWASDMGLTKICREDDIGNLAQLIPQAHRAENSMAWFADWQDLAQAMELQAPDTAAEKTAGKVSARTLQAIYKQWRTRKTYPKEFIIALDLSTEAFLKMGIRREAIIVTNSICPVNLRREGYRYLWLNDLPEAALKRQFLAWLNIWRPEKLSTL